MSSSDLEASVAERLGGRWAISRQAVVITVPLGIGVIALAAQASEHVVTWLGIALASVAVGSAWTYLMHRTVFRDRAVQPVGVRWVVATAVIVGILYVGTAVVLGLLLGVLEVNAAAPQFLPLFIVVVFWGLLLTLVLDSQWRFRVQREELIQQEVQQQLASAQELDVLREVRESVLSEVGKRITTSSQQVIQRIDRLLAEGESDAGSLAAELRAAAVSTVRPLSHQLEERSRRAHSTPRFFAALGNILRYQPFRPVAVSIVYVVTATPREIELHGWTIGLGLMAVTVAFIFAIMLPLNQAMNRWPDHHAVIYLAGLVCIQAPTVLLTPIREQVTGETITTATLLVTVLFGTLVVVATSSFGSWNRTRREVIADFRREVDAETIATLARGEALAKATREAAIILHGSVQTQLHACALSIEEATRNGDLVEVNRALVHARALLEQPNLSRGDGAAASLGGAIDERIAQWRGLLSVSVSIDSGTEALSGVVAGHVADVVEEGIANAFHHGSASEVRVEITCDANDLVVIIRDNGSGPGRGAPGLGSRLFSSYAARWNLASGQSGTELIVRIPKAGVWGDAQDVSVSSVASGGQANLKGA